MQGKGGPQLTFQAGHVRENVPLSPSQSGASTWVEQSGNRFAEGWSDLQYIASGQRQTYFVGPLWAVVLTGAQYLSN